MKVEFKPDCSVDIFRNTLELVSLETVDASEFLPGSLGFTRLNGAQKTKEFDSDIIADYRQYQIVFVKCLNTKFVNVAVTDTKLFFD